MPLSAIDFYNSLAKTLAERLIDWQMATGKFLTSNSGETAPVIPIEPIEAVIREAIEKTLQLAEKELGPYRHDHVISRMDAIDAIRSLKQSNSGMEVRK